MKSIYALLQHKHKVLHHSTKPVHLPNSKSYEGLIKANPTHRFKQEVENEVEQGREYIGARISNTLN